MQHPDENPADRGGEGIKEEELLIAQLGNKDTAGYHGQEHTGSYKGNAEQVGAVAVTFAGNHGNGNATDA